MAAYLSFFMTVVFLTSSVSKFSSSKTFHRTLIRLGIKSQYTRILVWFIPLVELIVAVLLVTPGGQRAGQIALLILLLLFAFVVGQAVFRKIDTDCNCFGDVLPEKLGISTLVRLIILLGAAIYLIVSEPVDLIHLPLDQLIHQAFASIGWFVAYILFMALARQFKMKKAS